MDLSLSEAEIAFRDEVRALAASTFPDGETFDRSREHEQRWHRALLDRGWAVNKWPVAFGGPGWTPTQSFIWEREMMAAGLPTQVGGMGPGMLAPIRISCMTGCAGARATPSPGPGLTWPRSAPGRC